VEGDFLNRDAAEGKFTVVATGHNLDDETARLLGNLLHWQREHLARQHPMLPEAGGGLVRKVKPLWRVSEVETAAYGFLKGIDYVTEECPMSEDATSLVYKEALSNIEDRMPGTRIVFYKGFLDPSNPLRKGAEDAAPDDATGAPRACASCGAPTYTETCSYCRLKERVRKARELRAARVSR